MGSQILCVDDSVTIRKLVKKALEPEGFEIIEAENGQVALDQCGKCEVSLCIVDVNMPVMDGFQFVEALKQKPEYSHIPVVFLTTESAAQKKQVGKELGVKGWIVKPFEAPSLAKVVKMLVKQ
ncbi:MAG TPA: response regulator [Clostridia bacterium]|nr:response regulator [Clostridia bacterium]